MADREESINIKIHLELAEEDEAKLRGITGEIEGADKKSPKEQKKQEEVDDGLDLHLKMK